MGLLLARFLAAQFGWLDLPTWWSGSELLTVGLVLMGAGCSVWHGLLLRRSDGLETGRGLFRWVRHPMYLGDFFTLTGFALLPLGPDSTVLWLVGVVAVWRCAVVEDAELAREWGEVHARWRGRTGLVFPGK